jgi:hypothetical protein
MQCPSNQPVDNTIPCDSTPSLPEWIIVPILACLVAISGAIVLVGWLVIKPVAVPAVESVAYDSNRAGGAVAETKSPFVAEIIPLPEDEPVVADEMPPRPMIQLHRRIRSRPEEAEPPVITASPRPMAGEAPMTPAADTDKSRSQTPNWERGLGERDGASRSPLRWSVESPRAGAMNLMLPIEVARIDDGIIPYNVRRLRFAGEAPKPLKLAVTPFVHDDLGSLLAKMGKGYGFTRLRNEDLLSLAELKKHDVVFLTCADLYARDFQAVLPLRHFVQQGGTLYASDLHADLVLAAFPEFRAKTAILPGVPQDIEASVVDPGLRTYLGRRKIPLNFEAPDWRPAAFDPSKVTVCLQGTYRNNQGQALSVPLLVKFRVQKGTVFFTSFHHSKNDTQIVQKLLEFLVFASVNARSEARVKELMQHSQFALDEMHPLLFNADNLGKKIEATYQHPGGGLQIALGFENLGAKFKLTLRSPSGQIIEHEDQGVYLIELPKADSGLWHYAVAPIELPYANFPIVVAVGGVKS